MKGNELAGLQKLTEVARVQYLRSSRGKKMLKSNNKMFFVRVCIKLDIMMARSWERISGIM